MVIMELFWGLFRGIIFMYCEGGIMEDFLDLYFCLVVLLVKVDLGVSLLVFFFLNVVFEIDDDSGLVDVVLLDFVGFL